MSNVGQAILDALAAAADPNQDVRHRGETQLQQLKANPDVFFSSCAELLTNASLPTRGRQLVGYLLKNNLSHPSCVQNTTLQVSVMSRAVVDPECSIRAVACTIISSAVRETYWPVEPVVKSLTEILTTRTGEPHAVHGAMRALSQIVDDCVQLLDMRQLTGAVVNAILPYLRAPPAGQEGMEVQLKAFDATAVVLEQAGIDYSSFSYSSMGPHVLNVIDACFINLQNPSSNQLSTKCVKCIVLSLGYHDLISDELFHRITSLMIMATISEGGIDEELRIEATEFWRGVLCFPRFAVLVEPTLEKVIPVLIRSMVYSDMEIGMLQASAEDWNVPDKLDDIRPRHYQARVNNAGVDDDDADDDDDDGEVEEWNLRRVSALTLDSIAEHYGEKIIFTVLGVIDGMMQPSKPWKELEAAILALGAIMDGCFDSMSPYLPDISTRLLQLLEDSSVHFLVGTISLWTMTQIGKYVVYVPEKLQSFLRCVLQKMQSPSKLLQEAATAALQKTVELCSEGQLSNDVPAIVDCVVKCLRGYQLKNRVLLFETLETVCEVLGEQLRASPDAVEALMVPLGEIWGSTPNDSPLLFSFFKCMSGVCRALGPAVQPALAKDIFERSYGLLVLHVQARAEARRMNQDPPEYEFLVTATDLLSGLFDALGTGLEPLVLQCNPRFVVTVLEMVHDEDPEIRQGGFSLLSDLARSCPAAVQEVLMEVVKASLQNLAVLDENTYGVVSNVAWFLCNLMENQMDMNNLPTLDAANGLPQLFAALARILGATAHTAEMRNMAENTCLCLGLMLYAAPGVESQPGCHLGLFAEAFCAYMRNVREESHKEQAVSGFLIAARQQLPLVVQFLHLFFDLALSVATASHDVKRAMGELLMAAKAHNTPQWQQQLSRYSEQLRTRLFHVYGIQ
ncbi:transportin 1 [Trypanosoma grayi]|uniref:transportin 1 n=1 Tax=Trypanosoma grayi TaxID=71804 RepID=UPI0004F41C67|nr:transportin 1 [Trypanosoma grayi]KEG12976.1 transportin 1 [Trypanosoma grayi]